MLEDTASDLIFNPAKRGLRVRVY